MALESEVRTQIEDIAKRAGYLWKFLDVPGKQKRLVELDEQMAAPDFWDKQEKAQVVVQESARIKGLINPLIDFRNQVGDLQATIELLDEMGEDPELEGEVVANATKLRGRLDELEIQSFLSGKFDRNNAILSINAGAGGTESCDWASMLLRMYTRWAERNGYEVVIEDMVDGEEAGISSATIRIMGENAFGYAKAERGVHRLVRISPFDSNARRHTSFTAVDVIAEIEDDVDIPIKEEDLRIDVYRASGKGGQHVNRTESAVRITHLPTGIVVQCQDDRSQIKNRATAMKVLKSRIYEKQQDEKRAEMERYYGEKGEIGWGNQIRSYVFQPYQMVKDLRTGVDTSNIQDVMDGDINRFIHAWLRAGCPARRNKDIQMED
ncbi:MAG: hypothetical protein E1N59_1919 [Puniceicoccaceae bacterium 5H]|nr:MAG: hypothetical protein E1N59_1919 [Puniceicoccaceae bacterium 5H]